MSRAAPPRAIRRTGLAIDRRSRATRCRPAVVERLEASTGRTPCFSCQSFDTDDAAPGLVDPRLRHAVWRSRTGVTTRQDDALLGPGASWRVAQVFAKIEAPGVIRHQAAGRVIFGELDGPVSARAEACATRSRGGSRRAVQDVRGRSGRNTSCLRVGGRQPSRAIRSCEVARRPQPAPVRRSSRR